MIFLEVSYLVDGHKREVREDLPDKVVLIGKGGARFRLFRAVRGGANGIVFEAQRLNQSGGVEGVCAVKLLRQLDSVRMDRFDNEGDILSSLRHPRIATFYDRGLLDLAKIGKQVPWLAMDLGGDNLRQHVQQYGPLPPGLLRRVAIQVSEALHYIHEADYIHRDLKPDNMVWVGDGSSGEVRLIDFGIAKRTAADVSGRPLDTLTRTGDFVGPQFYSSPEQIAYANDKTQLVDHRSDLFQLGKVLWFLGTGKLSAGIPSRRIDPTAGKLHDLLQNLLADDPDDRPPSAAVVAAQIEGSSW
jgi:serine/threonine protein kinase